MSYTKDEKKRLDLICEFGCIVCFNEMQIYSPALPHHIDGRTKPGSHFKTIPLCPKHHESGGVNGIAFHSTGKKIWEEKYGNQCDLLEQVNELIGYDNGTI